MSARRNVAAAGRSTGERGTTLVEVTLAVALFVMVMGSILGVFDTFTSAERRQDESLQNRRDVRQAVAEVVHDLRAASSIAAPSSSEAAATAVTVERRTGASDEAIRFVWDEAQGKLRRERSATVGGPVTATRVVLANATADPGGAAVFRYYDAVGRELLPGVDPAATIAACTTRIDITLTAVGRAGHTGGTMTATAAPRNLRAEEVASC